jgi:PAS domain S-box-containing protein
MNYSTNYLKALRLNNWMYAIVLFTVVLISFSSQMLIQNHLSNQKYDSHLINYSAKLRSDSQMLVKYALLLKDGRDYKSNRKDFINTYRQWKDTYRSLRLGSEFLSIPHNKNKEIEELFVIIDNPFNEIVAALDSMCIALERRDVYDAKTVNPYLEVLLKHEKTYLLCMEMIVFEYDRVLRNNIDFLRKLEWILFAILICCLMLEVFIVFLPLRRKLKVSFKELVETEKYSRELASQLQDTNNELQLSQKELREVNFALEKATYFVKTDTKGNIIYANDKYCNVTRYTMSELRGKPIFYNNRGDEKNIIYKHIDNPEVNAEVWQGEIFDHASDGTGFWMNVTLMPVFNNKGQLYRYFAICFDITKTKQAEKVVHQLVAEKMKQDADLQKIRTESMILGEERERNRITAEIHDNIGQMLTALKMRVEFVENGNTSTGLTEIKKIIASIIDETRKICTKLMPSLLSDFGLKSAIEDLVSILKATTNLKIEFIDGVEEQRITQSQKTVIYRILQEAVNNIVKHANARNVRIAIETDVENMYISISDDGIGFTMPPDIYTAHGKKNAYGLNSMQERAKYLDAEFEIHSEIGKGTNIRLRIPLNVEF